MPRLNSWNAGISYVKPIEGRRGGGVGKEGNVGDWTDLKTRRPFRDLLLLSILLLHHYNIA